jgi:AP-3 complex subunit delta-1
MSNDPIFQRGLQDLIKGIRSHKKDPSAFISQAMVNIKIELRSTDPFLKTEAVSFMRCIYAYVYVCMYVYLHVFL